MQVIFEDPVALLMTAILTVGLGCAFCFFGYRVFRLFLVVLGFAIGFIIGVTLVEGADTTVVLLAGFIIGAVLGVIAYFLYIVGFAIAGIALGATIGSVIAANSGFDQPTTNLLLVVSGMTGALLGLLLARYIIMLSTALTGGAQIVYGALLLIPGALAMRNGQLILQVSGTPASLSLLGWIVLGLAGFYVQYRTNRNRAD